MAQPPSAAGRALEVTGHPSSISAGGGGLGTCCMPLTTRVPDEGLAFPEARHKDASPLCLRAPPSPNSLDSDSGESQRWRVMVLTSGGLGSPSAQRRMCVL